MNKVMNLNLNVTCYFLSSVNGKINPFDIYRTNLYLVKLSKSNFLFFSFFGVSFRPTIFDKGAYVVMFAKVVYN